MTHMDKIIVFVCQFTIIKSSNYCILRGNDIVTVITDSFEKSAANFELINTNKLNQEQINQFMNQRLALNDLSSLVKHSKLPHKDKIANYLSIIVENSREAENLFIKSNISLNHLKYLYISGGKNVISIIKEKKPNYKEQILEIVKDLRFRIEELLKCYQGLKVPLLNMEFYLTEINDPIINDTNLNEIKQEEILGSFWKWLFASSNEIRTYEKNLVLLLDLEKNRKVCVKSVNSAINELHKMQIYFEDEVYGQVSAPMLSSEKLESLIKRIEKALEEMEKKNYRN